MSCPIILPPTLLLGLSPFLNNPLSSNAFVPPAKGTLIGLCSLKLGLVMGTVGSVGVAGSGGGVERGGGGR